eukprot:SAG31_NODE_8117_length_1519_cov_1.597183_1_plen_125_part_00
MHQMAMSGLVGIVKLLLRWFRMTTSSSAVTSAQMPSEKWSAGQMRRPQLCQIPLLLVAAIAVVRNFSQVWMAQCIQYGPNPGLPKTVSGGVNTVTATLVGVICFKSKLVRTHNRLYIKCNAIQK